MPYRAITGKIVANSQRICRCLFLLMLIRHYNTIVAEVQQASESVLAGPGVIKIPKLITTNENEQRTHRCTKETRRCTEFFYFYLHFSTLTLRNFCFPGSRHEHVTHTTENENGRVVGRTSLRSPQAPRFSILFSREHNL